MRTFATALIVCTSGLSVACNQSGSGAGAHVASNGVRQTKFPGQITAGGTSSGEVMTNARSAPVSKDSAGGQGIPRASGDTTGSVNMGSAQGGDKSQEGLRGQAPAGGGVRGTPGIPEGSGGTPSGAEMGGTTSGAAATQIGPAPNTALPSVPALDGATPAQQAASKPGQQAAAVSKEQAAAQAEKEKEELATSMAGVAAHWRTRASANGWDLPAQVPVAASQPGGMGGNAAVPAIRSEKAGTAPPSGDIKDPTKKGK